MGAANSPAETPMPPYYAVIFTSLRTADDRGYAHMADQMIDRASEMPGFLGVESVRDERGLGITVSYWESEDAIRNWKSNLEHQVAQTMGKKVWYSDYTVRVAKVERFTARRPATQQTNSTNSMKTDKVGGVGLLSLLVRSVF
jgi:heme-degrading monooxygenase HmoA